MEDYIFLTQLPYLVIFAYCGMMMNFFKKKIKGETIIEIKDYFSNHFKSTVIAVVSTLVFTIAYYVSLSVGQPVDILSAVGIGYTCDDLFNKWDKSTQS